MTNLSITPDNRNKLVTSLLNTDIAFLHTQNHALCRELVWELQNAKESLDPQRASADCLIYCIQRLFNCLSEEAQTFIQKQIDNPVPIG